LSPRHDDDVDLTFSDKVGHPHGFGFEFEMLTTRRPSSCLSDQLSAIVTGLHRVMSAVTDRARVENI
jgi:hypothetical protein